MSTWEIVGWFGNGCYFTRFLIQWLRSEQAKRSVTPRSFWWFSLAGATSLGIYVLSMPDWILLSTYVVTFMIYSRNLWLAYYGARGGLVGPLASTAIAVSAGLFLVWSKLQSREMQESSFLWLSVALVGVTLWASRFLVQWRASERVGRSHFPRSFWWISLAGSAFLIAYSIHKGDAILIAGYAPSFLVPARNLMLRPAEEE